jgi:signal transduction histidine kinase
VTRDLTQKKIFEDHILKQNRLLEEYAHAVSHDLQEPLRKIMVFSSILHEQADNPVFLRNVQKIENAARRMRELVSGILDYARLSEQDQATVDTDLNTVLSDIEADQELLLSEREAEIVYGKLPVVNAVSVQMHQLFTNLLGNALRHGGHGTRITISAKPARSMVGFTAITVSDNGAGFDPQYADKIFDLFRRLPGDVHGTGIGLALCRRIAENHGGSITATGEPRKGAQFTVTLPLAQTQP